MQAAAPVPNNYRRSTTSRPLPHRSTQKLPKRLRACLTIFRP
ncbi:hypothetical protein ACVIWV_004556 [Bradyrhizobium diazoefficiens]